MVTGNKTLIGALEDVAQSIDHLRGDQYQTLVSILQEIAQNTRYPTPTDSLLQALVTILQEIAQNSRRSTDDLLQAMITILQEIAQNTSTRRPRRAG